MKIKSIVYVIAFGFAGSCVQATPLGQGYGYNSSVDIVDREALLLVKGELEITKNILIQIRDSQNYSLAGNAASSASSALKELLYITTSVGLGGGCLLLGVAHEANLDFGSLLSTREGRSAVLIASPFLIGGSITVYVILKLIFGWLLSSPKEKSDKDIKEAIQLIDLTLNKLTYEINKIERLCNERSRTN